MDLERYMVQRLNDFLTPFQGENYLITEGPSGRERRPRDSLISAKLDVLEKPDHFIVSAELPGVKKDDIQVHLDGNQLSILAERKEEKKEDSDRYHYRERCYGSIKRIVTMPESADTDNVKAEFENGVLSLSFNKKAPDAGRKRIAIA